MSLLGTRDQLSMTLYSLVSAALFVLPLLHPAVGGVLDNLPESIFETSLEYDLYSSSSQKMFGTSIEIQFPLFYGPFATATDRKLEEALYIDNATHFGPNMTLFKVYPERNLRYSAKLLQRVIKVEHLAVLDVEACILACIHEKSFKCYSVDFYSDSFSCNMYAVVGSTAEEFFPKQFDEYLLPQSVSTHYTLTADVGKPLADRIRDEGGETETTGLKKVGHFAVGWKAIGIGWGAMAKHQLDLALVDNANTKYHTPYLIHGLQALVDTAERASFISEVTVLLSGLDFTTRLSRIEQRILISLREFFQGASAGTGDVDKFLEKLDASYEGNSLGSEADLLTRIVRSTVIAFGPAGREGSPARFRLMDALSRLARSAANDGTGFALYHLTTALNPYSYPDKTSPSFQEFATGAADGAYLHSNITLSSGIVRNVASILYYYGEYGSLYARLDGSLPELIPSASYRKILGKFPLTLTSGSDLELSLNGANISFIENRVIWDLFEKQHLSLLQLGMFNLSVDLVELYKMNDYNSQAKTDTLYRMMARTYFEMADVFPEEAESLPYFDPVIDEGGVSATSALSAYCRSYHLSAAVVQSLRREDDPATLTTEIGQLRNTANMSPRYAKLFDALVGRVDAERAELSGNYTGAEELAKSSYEAELEGRAASYDKPTEARVIDEPRADVYYAALLYRHSVIDEKETIAIKQVGGTLTSENDVMIDLFKKVTTTPPQNTSGMVLKFGEVLLRSHRKYEQDHGLQYLQRADENWQTSDPFPAKSRAKDIIKEKTKIEPGPCDTPLGMISDTECPGFYLIIILPFVLIIIIILAVVMCRLRKKAKSPLKEKDEGFMFMGPIEDRYAPGSRTSMDEKRFTGDEI